MTRGRLLGRGVNGDVFAWGVGRVVKLARIGDPAHWVPQEAGITRAVHAAGLRVPRVVDVVEVEGRRGIVFERVEGLSMRASVKRAPWRMGYYAELLAELHADMHRHIVATIPSHRERLENRIRVAESLRDDLKQEVLRVLQRLPDGNALCHGDFLPVNVLMAPRGPVIIDWGNATVGNPLADVARSWLLMTVNLRWPAHRRLRRWIVNTVSGCFCRRYLGRYLRLRSLEPEQVEAWLVPVAGARFHMATAWEQELLLDFLRNRLPKAV